MEPPRPRRGSRSSVCRSDRKFLGFRLGLFRVQIFFSCELAFRGPVCNRLTIFPYGISRETRRAHPEFVARPPPTFRLLRFFPSRRGCDFDRRRRFGVTPTRTPRSRPLRDVNEWRTWPQQARSPPRRPSAFAPTPGSQPASSGGSSVIVVASPSSRAPPSPRRKLRRRRRRRTRSRRRRRDTTRPRVRPSRDRPRARASRRSNDARFPERVARRAIRRSKRFIHFRALRSRLMRPLSPLSTGPPLPLPPTPGVNVGEAGAPGAPPAYGTQQGYPPQGYYYPRRRRKRAGRTGS